MRKDKFFLLYWPLCVLLIALFVILFGCQNNDLQNIEISETEMVERKIIWNWFNLAIGESSKEELIIELGIPIRRHDLLFGESIIGDMFVYQIDDFPAQETRSDFFYCYIVSDVIEAIRFFSTSVPFGRGNVSLDELVDEFGLPDIVSYRRNYPNVRLVVWLDEGVQADVSFIPGSSEGYWFFTLENTKISGITYFYPLSKDTYFQSFLSQWYSDEAPKGDEIDAHPMDPFLWEE